MDSFHSLFLIHMKNNHKCDFMFMSHHARFMFFESELEDCISKSNFIINKRRNRPAQNYKTINLPDLPTWIFF